MAVIPKEIRLKIATAVVQSTYDIYLNMDASAKNVAENGNTCDNIEGLRAELLSVKSHDKKNE